MEFSTSLAESIDALAARLGESHWWARVRAGAMLARHDGKNAAWIREHIGDERRHPVPYVFLFTRDIDGHRLRTADEMAQDLALTLDEETAKWVPDPNVEHAQALPIVKAFSSFFGEMAKEVFQSQAAQGYKTRPPKGYRKTDDRVGFQGRLLRVIEADPPNATRIQVLFRLVARGVTIQEAAELVGFNKDTARDCLTNPSYPGYIQYKGSELRNAANRRTSGVLFPGRFPPLVARALYNQVAAKRNKSPLEETWEIIDNGVQIKPVWECPVDLWMALDTIPTDAQGCIQRSFLTFEAGTQRQEVESWFESEYSLSAAEFSEYADRLRKAEADKD